MGFSPCHSLFHRRLSRKLYRKLMLVVILAGVAWLASSWLAAQILTPPYRHKATTDKGPRALGLVQISPKGKARLIPIAIMMDGKFYDAGSYKAAPVPLALDFGIVYEGFRTGVSQGIFTISQPGQLNHAWIAEGIWTPAGERAPEKHKKYSAPVITEDDRDGPPVLHRRNEKSDSDSGSDKDKDKDKKDPAKPATAPASPPTAGSPSSPPTSGTTAAPDATKASAPAPAKTTSTSASSAEDEPIEDPNRPRLRRGKPDPNAHHEAFTTFDALPDTGPSAASGIGKTDATAKDSAAVLPQIVMIPAISDIGGPDPRPYLYDVKPAEEAIYRNKMLDLATTQLRRTTGTMKEAQPSPGKVSANKSAGKTGKTSKPAFDFDDVNLRIFDLSNSNEPVLVLSAKVRPPATGATGSTQEPKEITLIARTNLEGEMQKLFFSETDSRRLDAIPRMELIDAVDADGDGRGELLFRRTFEGGSAYAIYRVTADRLWPLFEGTP
jgi:hypothetical protein